MIRIRYTKVYSSLVCTCIPLKTKIVSVIIDLEDKQWRIEELSGNELASGRYSSKDKAKRQVRRKLKELGFNPRREVRK